MWLFLLPLAPTEEGGTVIYRTHWSLLVRGLVAPLALTLGVAAAWLLGALPGEEWSQWPWWALVGLGGLSLLPPLWLVWRYENWRNDYYMVTPERLVDVKRLPWGLRTEIKEALLRNVQNLSLRIPSLLAASLDYGDIQVDTAGKEGSLLFRSIGRPREVLAQLSRRVDALRGEDLARAQEQRERELAAWFAAYEGLPRISLLRHPPAAEVGQTLKVEWRVDGMQEPFETYLTWDLGSGAGPARAPAPDPHPFVTPPLQGGSGNYQAQVIVPLAERLSLRAWARSGEQVWSSPEAQVPVTDYGVDLPERGTLGLPLLVRWWAKAPLAEARVEWAPQPLSQAVSPSLTPAEPEEGGSYVARLVPEAGSELYCRLAAKVRGRTVVSPEYRVSLETPEAEEP